MEGKLKILELKRISANIDMDFFNVGSVTVNYNVRRNLDRLRAMERTKLLCLEVSKLFIQSHTL